MSSILNKFSAKMSTTPQTGGRPPAAVELSPESVIAAAKSGFRRGESAPGEAGVYASAPLPRGALVPGIEEANVRMPDAVASAIRSALEQVSPRTHVVTLVLPDTVVRVFVLDFDSLPSRAAEAVPVVRFRLRKMVPFDVEPAGVGYQMLSRNEAECKVLAAVIPGPILAEYEAAVRAAGYEPGAVLPSSLAALETLGSMEAVLAANLNTQSITTAITNGQDLLLYRTLDLPADPMQRITEIQRSIAVAIAYYEDKLGARPRQLYYAGIDMASEFAQWIGDPELTIVEWAPRPDAGAMTTLPQTSYAGVAGALEGVS